MKKLIKYDLKSYYGVGIIGILVLILNLYLNETIKDGGGNLTIFGYGILLFYTVSKINKEAIETRGYTLKYLLPYSKNEIILSKIVSFIIVSSLYTLIAIILFWANEKNIKCSLGFLHSEFNGASITVLNISLIWNLVCCNILTIAFLLMVIYTDIKFKLRVRNSIFNHIMQGISMLFLFFIILVGTIKVEANLNLGLNIANISGSNILESTGAFVSVANNYIRLNFISLLVYIGLGLWCFKAILKEYRLIDVR